MKIQRILMPTDFSASADVALDHALFLARRYRATLHLLHVVVLFADEGETAEGFPSMEELFDHVEQTGRSEMGRLIDARGTEVVRIEEAIRRGAAAAPAIAEYVEDREIDLVVMGSHGRRGLRRFLLGSVTEEVLRTVACPVLILRDHEGGERLARPERVLVPFDFSPGSRRAFEVGDQLARDFEAQIDLLHVVSPPIAAIGHGLAVPSWSHVEVSAEVGQALDRFVADVGAGVPVRSHVLHGSPGPEIVHFAEQHDSDLIVIGSHGLEGLSRWLLGSVAEKVARGATCPVLVLRDAPDEAAAATSDSPPTAR